MIKSVTVKNYILIDELALEFDEGYNVFTGETGAGKSIIIGAIDAALGAKISKDVIKTGCDKAYIELVIKLNDDFNPSILVNNGIDIADNEIIISREILNSTARSRINGIIVNLDIIKDLREQILDIHTQHQSYNYLQTKNHIMLLDNFALKPHRDNVILLKEKYSKYLSLQNKLDQILETINSTKQQEDFLRFQTEEIEKANIEDVNEYENLTKELEILANVEKLKELSYSSYWTLYGDDGNILDSLSNIRANISKLVKMDESTSAIEESFINAYENLKEVSSELRSYFESKENDNERMDFISERLAVLDKIKRKYGNSLDEVLKTYEKLSEELNNIEISQDEVVKIEKEIKELYIEIEDIAQQVSNTRKELAKVLSEAVTKELEKLELPKSRFAIRVDETKLKENGKDDVEFLITTNVSEDLKPLAKTASGGEISRIMLAIKTIFSNADNTNTVIFDEIDTGISGKASQAVADEIINLAKSHQIILITHQPIIAAKASRHFYVKKEQTDTTKVSVYNLTGENRIKAIALLAAGEINEESENFAKNLILK